MHDQKQYFLDYLKLRQEFSDKLDAVYKDGINIIDFTAPAFDAMDKLFAAGFTEQQYDWYLWWLYDAPEGSKTVEENGIETDLTNPEVFCDWLFAYKNK